MGLTGAQTLMLKGLITNPDHPEFQGVFKQGDFWIATDRMSIFYLKKKPNLPICQGCDQNLVDLLDTPLSARETERTKALDEVESAYKHYLELKDAYVKKYRSDSALNATSDLLSELITLLFKD